LSPLGCRPSASRPVIQSAELYQILRQLTAGPATDGVKRDSTLVELSEFDRSEPELGGQGRYRYGADVARTRGPEPMMAYFMEGLPYLEQTSPRDKSAVWDAVWPAVRE
jgi:hypothetical protein